jgi:hypothetical protein
MRKRKASGITPEAYSFAAFSLVIDAQLVQKLITIVPQPPETTSGYTAAAQNDKHNNDNDKRSVILFGFFERGHSCVFVHSLFSCLISD